MDSGIPIHDGTSVFPFLQGVGRTGEYVRHFRRRGPGRRPRTSRLVSVSHASQAAGRSVQNCLGERRDDGDVRKVRTRYLSTISTENSLRTLLNENLRWTTEEFSWWEEALVRRRLVGTLVEALYVHLSDAIVGALRTARCEECGAAFLTTYARQRFCPNPAGYALESRCACRARARRARCRGRSTRPRTCTRRPSSRSARMPRPCRR